MKTIKVNNLELLLVPVPTDVISYNVTFPMYLGNKDANYGITIKCKSGQMYFQPLGLIDEPKIVNTLSKLTEEQAKELVEDCIYFAKCYKKYNILELEELPNEPFSLQLSCWTALESFNSLMIANKIDTNNEYLILIKNE